MANFITTIAYFTYPSNGSSSKFAGLLSEFEQMNKLVFPLETYCFYVFTYCAPPPHPHPFLVVVVEAPTKFLKRGCLTGSQFLEWGCWEKGSDLDFD